MDEASVEDVSSGNVTGNSRSSTLSAKSEVSHSFPRVATLQAGAWRQYLRMITDFLSDLKAKSPMNISKGVVNERQRVQVSHRRPRNNLAPQRLDGYLREWTGTYRYKGFNNFFPSMEVTRSGGSETTLSHTILSSWCGGARGKGRPPDSTTRGHTSSELRLVTISTTCHFPDRYPVSNFDLSSQLCSWLESTGPFLLQVTARATGLFSPAIIEESRPGSVRGIHPVKQAQALHSGSTIDLP